jgi:hypothetical protein
MSATLKVEDICEMFHSLTEFEIQAASIAMIEGQESNKQMGQGYILAIERARKILRSIIKDVK